MFIWCRGSSCKFNRMVSPQQVLLQVDIRDRSHAGMIKQINLYMSVMGMPNIICSHGSTQVPSAQHYVCSLFVQAEMLARWKHNTLNKSSFIHILFNFLIVWDALRRLNAVGNQMLKHLAVITAGSSKPQSQWTRQIRTWITAGLLEVQLLTSMCRRKI